MRGDDALGHMQIRLNELRSEIAWIRFRRAFDTLREAKFNATQPRIPAGYRFGGRWTDGNDDTGGPSRTRRPSTSSDTNDGGTDSPRLALVSSRATGSGRNQPAWGNLRELAPASATRLTGAQISAELAVNRARAVDPNWSPSRSFSQPNSVNEYVNHYESVRREAERHMHAVIAQRNLDSPIGIGHNRPPPAAPSFTRTIPGAPPDLLSRSSPVRPLGFPTEYAYLQFNYILSTGLRDLGYTDAYPVMVGSSVSVFSYGAKTVFDTGRRSDLDLGIVSAQLYRDALVALGGRRARDRGRTLVINKNSKMAKKLKLNTTLDRLNDLAGRKVSIVIYRDWKAFLSKNGKYRILP